MREVFKPSVTPVNDQVFYTICPDDVGKSAILTEAGTIHVSDLMGRILNVDVGKRIIHVRVKDGWIWQVENDRQFRERTERQS